MASPPPHFVGAPPRLPPLSACCDFEPEVVVGGCDYMGWARNPDTPKEVGPARPDRAGAPLASPGPRCSFDRRDRLRRPMKTTHTQAVMGEACRLEQALHLRGLVAVWRPVAAHPCLPNSKAFEGDGSLRAATTSEAWGGPLWGGGEATLKTACSTQENAHRGGSPGRLIGTAHRDGSPGRLIGTAHQGGS